MDFAALVDARHSWNHTRRVGDASYLGLLSDIPPLQEMLTAAVIVMVTAQLHCGLRVALTDATPPQNATAAAAL